MCTNSLKSLLSYLEKRHSLLNGVEETERNFKYAKNVKNENNSKQRIRYRFLKHETKDQLDNKFVIDLETHYNQEFAEAFDAGLYDVNRLRDRWDMNLTPDEIVIEKENGTVFDGSNGNCEILKP